VSPHSRKIRRESISEGFLWLPVSGKLKKSWVWSFYQELLSDLRIGHGHHRNQTMIRLSITGREFRKEQEKSLSFTVSVFS